MRKSSREGLPSCLAASGRDQSSRAAKPGRGHERTSANADTGLCSQSGRLEPRLGVGQGNRCGGQLMAQVPMPRPSIEGITENEERGASAKASSIGQDMRLRLAKLWGKEHRISHGQLRPRPPASDPSLCQFGVSVRAGLSIALKDLDVTPILRGR